MLAESAMTHKPHSYLGYSYPAQLTALTKKAWPSDRLGQLPEDNHLRRLFDVAFHASLLRDEDRQVIFRIMLGDPALLPPEDGPPSGLMPLYLDRPRPYNEQEIRRLSMAALFFRSMIGVSANADNELEIWGMVVSGTRWLSSLAGGRYLGAPEPDSLVIHSLGPGRLTVHFGRQRLATLMGGSDLFVFHGYSELYLGGEWRKATPAFNASLCARFGVAPLEFDGSEDALLHPYTGDGSRHMEYVRDRGSYDDLPLAEIVDVFQSTYPAFLSRDREIDDPAFAESPST